VKRNWVGQSRKSATTSHNQGVGNDFAQPGVTPPPFSQGLATLTFVGSF
jgi:hypothetical protein